MCVFNYTIMQSCFLSFTAGTQVRSRVILSYPSSVGSESCPGSLTEVRPCSHGSCIAYSWHASTWSEMDDTREVWCENSHGTKVTGKSLPVWPLTIGTHRDGKSRGSPPPPPYGKQAIWGKGSLFMKGLSNHVWAFFSL